MQQPTIGRKVWLWVPTEDEYGEMIDRKQAFDATVIFVHQDGSINVSATDHVGYSHTFAVIKLCDPNEDQHCVRHDVYATWMPYQKAQHDKQATA